MAGMSKRSARKALQPASRPDGEVEHSMNDHSICYFVYMRAAVEGLWSHEADIRPLPDLGPVMMNVVAFATTDPKTNG